MVESYELDLSKIPELESLVPTTGPEAVTAQEVQIFSVVEEAIDDVEPIQQRATVELGESSPTTLPVPVVAETKVMGEVEYVTSGEIELPKLVFDEVTMQFVEVSEETSFEELDELQEALVEVGELPPIAEEFIVSSVVEDESMLVEPEEALGQRVPEGVEVVSLETEELTPLHELIQQKIEVLRPETNEIVESLLEQLETLLQSPERIVVKTEEITTPLEIVIEERATELVEEILSVLGIPYNEVQLEYVVTLILQHHQVETALSVSDESVVEIGTREFFTKAKSFMQYVQSLFEPIQTLIGRTVLLASKSV